MSAQGTLLAARDLLATDGWCPDLLLDYDGRHCAIGAVCEVMSPAGTAAPDSEVWDRWWDLRQESPEFREVLAILASHVPAAYQFAWSDDWDTVSNYNNKTNGAAVLSLFGAAIAETVPA